MTRISLTFALISIFSQYSLFCTLRLKLKSPNPIFFSFLLLKYTPPHALYIAFLCTVMYHQNLFGSHCKKKVSVRGVIK